MTETEDRQELYDRYEEEFRKPALYKRKDKMYEIQGLQVWEKQQNSNLPNSLTQIERYIAKNIVNSHQILTFRETNEIFRYNGGIFHRNKVTVSELHSQQYQEYNNYICHIPSNYLLVYPILLILRLYNNCQFLHILYTKDLVLYCLVFLVYLKFFP